jgi:hypothetical protein
MTEIGKYNYFDDGTCSNSDGTFFKAGGCTAYINYARNKNGWVYGYDLISSHLNICRPIYLNDDDVFESKDEASAQAYATMRNILHASNFDGIFDALIHCIFGEHISTNLTQVTEKENKQMTIFDLI